MTDNLFYKIDQEPAFLDKVRSYSSTAKWTYVPFMKISTNFQKTLGLELIKQDSLLEQLREKFDGTLRLYMFPGMTVYNWHKDVEIGCSINLVMEDYNSHTLFNPSHSKKIIDNVIELKYEKNKWYLFNSQILHCVVNMDPRDRLLLTMTFPNNVRYQEIFDFLNLKNQI
jgi:hypothetical protein